MRLRFVQLYCTKITSRVPVYSFELLYISIKTGLEEEKLKKKTFFKMT